MWTMVISIFNFWFSFVSFFRFSDSVCMSLSACACHFMTLCSTSTWNKWRKPPSLSRINSDPTTSTSASRRTWSRRRRRAPTARPEDRGRREPEELGAWRRRPPSLQPIATTARHPWRRDQRVRVAKELPRLLHSSTNLILVLLQSSSRSGSHSVHLQLIVPDHIIYNSCVYLTFLYYFLKSCSPWKFVIIVDGENIIYLNNKWKWRGVLGTGNPNWVEFVGIVGLSKKKCCVYAWWGCSRTNGFTMIIFGSLRSTVFCIVVYAALLGELLFSLNLSFAPSIYFRRIEHGTLEPIRIP